jgi:hypothetical protein
MIKAACGRPRVIPSPAISGAKGSVQPDSQRRIQAGVCPAARYGGPPVVPYSAPQA